MLAMKNFTLLNDLSPAQFLRDYWHKKPLLIRQAVPAFTPLLSVEALFEMAARDDVESRLVTHFKQEWKVENGPVTSLPLSSKKDWTLLVQGVNLHHDAADALLRQFRFISDTRLDDLMISYATDTGGVGPHVDSYDVFLLQAQGQRRWKIGAGEDLTLAQGSALKILKNFMPEQEFVLEPGDMLYLPPQYAHEGTAIGECMTYSIGFRAPAFQELGEAFLQFMAESIDFPGRYVDADLTPTKHPAEISRNMLSQISQVLNKVRFTDDDIAIFVGEYLSEPKTTVFFESPPCPLTLSQFTNAINKRGVTLSRKTQMLYRGKHVFINGESFVAGKEDKPTLCALANQRRLDGAAASVVSTNVLEALYTWYEDGWTKLG